MNSEAAPPESTPSSVQPPQPSKAGTGRRIALILVIVGAAIVALWLDARQTLTGIRGELGKRLADSEVQTRDARAAVRQTQESVQALQGRVAELEARLAESQDQRVALEAMYQELTRGRDERVIAEVEQAVSIAAQQLQLAGNVEAALIALSGADARLARAAGSQFIGVRKLIARDIERLRALPTADVPGMAVKLESVIAGIDSLPLAYERRPAQVGATATKPSAAAAKTQAPAPAWERLAAEAWAELRQLVRIERIDGAGAPDPGLLSPSQAFFLRENLKLRLVNARLALLSHDARSFREDMRQAAAWLERYFDVRAKPAQNALATVKALGVADLAIEPPSLNETLAALRNFKAARK